MLCVNECCITKQSQPATTMTEFFSPATDKSAVASWVGLAMSSCLFWLLFLLFFPLPVTVNIWPISVYGSVLSTVLENWGMITGTILLTGHLPSLGKAAGTPNRRQTGREKGSEHKGWCSCVNNLTWFCIILKELNATKAAQKSPSLKFSYEKVDLHY